MLENLPPIISYIKSIVSTASILVAAYLAYYFGMKSYFKQQQASRVQKLYYEDTLLAILKHADEVINDFANGYTRFVAALTRLKEVRRSNAPITQTEINEFDHFISDIKRTNFYMSSSRELLIDVFGKPGYILHQWLFKCDQDCGMSGILGEAH